MKSISFEALPRRRRLEADHLLSLDAALPGGGQAEPLTSAALDLGVPAVKSRLHRGRTLLRQALLHEAGPAPEPFLRNLDQSG